MNRIKVYIICFLSFLAFKLQGQGLKDGSSITQQKYYLEAAVDSLQLDSLTILPASIQLSYQGNILDTSWYHYDINTNYIHFHQQVKVHENPILIQYQTLAFALHQKYAHKDLSIYDSTAYFKEIVQPKHAGIKSQEELFATPKLYKNGSISRGISVGNRQNVFVNSALNLQIEGALSDDLQIRASITDQNIPIQPEGNTQQLQDFDNVYLELFNDDFSITAGDIILQQSGNQWLGNSRDGNDLNINQQVPYFLQYRRNVQGATFSHRYQFSDQHTSQTHVGFALSKGKFASVALQVEEGVQGPYQINASGSNLSGGSMPNTSTYFIIANSEKVYLDGQLLQRGFDKDYTINYNLSEITFTSKVILTRFSRLYIDYEYADRNYSRSVITASHRHDYKRISVYASYFREKDNPNQALGFTLSDDDKWLLSEAGDRSEQAWIPAIDSASDYQHATQYQTNRDADVPGVGNMYMVFYDRKDSLVDGNSYEMYEYAGREGKFKLDFSFVGEGNGNYVISSAAVNTKVYEWVAPINGNPVGNYEPVRTLAPPLNQQMLVLGAEVSLSQKDQLKVETAFSNYDLNSLSEEDSEDDQGRGLLLQYHSLGRKLFNSQYLWESSLTYEYRHKYFQTIDPYRSIEFERDWTLGIIPTSDSSERYDDQIVSTELKISKDARNQLSYQWIYRDQRVALKGQQHKLSFDKSAGKFQLRGNGFLMQNQTYATASAWKRLSAEAFYRGKYIQPGYKFNLDQNQQNLQETDSLIYSSMYFDEHVFYLRNADSLQGIYQLNYSQRKNYLPYLGQMYASDLAKTLTASADLPIHQNHQLNMQLAYRQLDFLNDSIDVENSFSRDNIQTNTLMGQLNWQGSLAKGSIKTSLNYSLANGREPRREFVYIRVPVGEGAYTWRDDNQNGIEEIDEFYEARYFDERNYMRVFVPTNEFQLAYLNDFDFQLNIQPPSKWLDKNGLRSILGKFSNVSSWSIHKRISDESIKARLIPWFDSEEENLLSTRENVRSSLFFNRRETSHGAEAGFRNIRRKQLLNGGFEERIQQAYTLGSRWNINRYWGLRVQAERGLEIQKLQLSQQSGRNFNIDYYQFWPEISWQMDMKMRISAKYTLLNKLNQNTASNESGGEQAVHQTIGLDFRHTLMMKHNINASLEFIDIQYGHELNSPLAYEMLDGLNTGNNVRWTVNWQQHILEGLQLVLNYYGRKSEESESVHSGSMMIRALF